MIFQQPLMHNNEPNPSRWLSDHKGRSYYSVQKFEYYRGSWCAEYYRAYSYPGVHALSDDNHSTLSAAIKACESHKEKTA